MITAEQVREKLREFAEKVKRPSVTAADCAEEIWVEQLTDWFNAALAPAVAGAYEDAAQFCESDDNAHRSVHNADQSCRTRSVDFYSSQSSFHSGCTQEVEAAGEARCLKRKPRCKWRSARCSWHKCKFNWGHKGKHVCIFHCCVGWRKERGDD